ncbi:MAG: sigma-70 family RNA polymerase sigma factor [Planctomycetes bacterium]|nr:sigma-70 family RNA polymerase sigma factor [Planctomycetota bacterium]
MPRTAKNDLTATWKRLRRTKSVTIRNELVERYLPLVDKLAEVLARRLWPRVTSDELASAGYDGLIAAVNSFDPNRGVKFETYCRQRILGAIRDWQREIDPLGRSGRNFERTLNAVEDRFSAEKGRAPTTQEMATKLGLTHTKFMRMKRTVLASHCVPLEAPNERRETSRSASFIPADPGPSPIDYTERELIREYLTRGLKEQDRLIITLYYYERLTMAEIGSVLGVSESRVCQRHTEIVEQLRARFSSSACDLVA